jgi:hypothetical protein
MKASRGFKDNSYTYGKNRKQKVKAGVLNDQYLMALKWNETVEFMKSADLQAMMTLIESHNDPEENTVEDWHPMAFAGTANAEDNPN